MLTSDFMLFAEFFQFYIQDGLTDETLPVHWEQADEDAMAIVTDNVISVHTVRELDVPVTLNIADYKPEEEDLSEWDHVIECTLMIPSGKLLIASATDEVYEGQRFDVEPGEYGVRVYYGSLDQIDAEGFEGDDNYKICIWKLSRDDQPPAFRILKEWTPAKPY